MAVPEPAVALGSRLSIAPLSETAPVLRGAPLAFMLATIVPELAVVPPV